MELKDLSSNWKKLQQTLRKDDLSSSSTNNNNAKKRKATPSVQQNENSVKKVKLAGQRRRLQRADIALSRNRPRPGKMATEGASTTKEKKKERENNVGGKDTAPSASLALWAEDNDIPAADIALAYGGNVKSTKVPATNGEVRINQGLSSNVEVGKYIALDCEMVGVGGDENRSVLARVSVVNFHGEQVYDSFVKPKEYVTDWRTSVSGVAPRHMIEARDLGDVQIVLANLLQGRILVGHAIHHDLDALFLSHPKRDIRDTSRHRAFRKLAAGKTPGLKKLSKELLGVDIQGGEHSSVSFNLLSNPLSIKSTPSLSPPSHLEYFSSKIQDIEENEQLQVEDARACMLLFRRNKDAFEADHAKRFPGRPSDAAKGGGNRPSAGTIEDSEQQKKNRKKKKKGKK
ncbi:MAG: 3'-5' exonuclease [Sclerophora amabilis]|nr:MAG: 3'-5' exonuclease [Sclerophora amabilis]